MVREFAPLERRMGVFRAQFRMLSEETKKLLNLGSSSQGLNL